MSLDPDALADMASNRGLKLVRSRVRTPGKAGYGLYGLSDPAGEPAFGLSKAGKPEASPEAVAEFLRKGEAGDWKASLKAVGAKPRKAAPQAAVRAKDPRHEEPAPAPAPPAPLVLREAEPKDADTLVALFALLDHDIDAAAIRANLTAIAKAKEPLLVLSEGQRVVAACGFTRTTMPHRPLPLGRITVLVVAEDRRRQGLGERLLAEAEARLRTLGCTLIEVTSNDRLLPAHSFYRAHGYERTSIRFAKTLSSG